MANNDTLKELKKMVIEYDIENAENLATKAVEEGLNPIDCSAALIEGITEVGIAFSKEELFLPDLVAASEVVKKASPIINKAIELRGDKVKSIGKVILGTVAGDIHSIGKDMVSTLLFASGFEVIDLGIDVSADKFIEVIKESSPDILAMSALLTTTASELKKVIERLKVENIRDKIKVIIGGAPINQEFADEIGADGYGATAAEGVVISKKLIGIN